MSSTREVVKLPHQVLRSRREWMTSYIPTLKNKFRQ